MESELNNLRAELDQIDDRLIEALARRQEVIDQVAHCKANSTIRLEDASREDELLDRLVQAGKQAKLDEFYVNKVFREILDHSVRRQQCRLLHGQSKAEAVDKTFVVGHLGHEGSYSKIAAAQHFGATDLQVDYYPCESLPELGQLVADGILDAAMLPIENTTAGSINAAYELLGKSNLAVIGEEVVRIDHCLLARTKAPASRINHVLSHPQAIEQCSEFLKTLPNCRVESVADTALAARTVAEAQSDTMAAIAGSRAADLYDLQIIRRNIANQQDNMTRFLVIAAKPRPVDTRIRCKTSVAFGTSHEQGSLLRALGVFASHQLNLTKLESRPRPNKPWEYLFYVDFEGNVDDAAVTDAMEELSACTSFTKVFGSYPVGTPDKTRARPRKKIPATAAHDVLDASVASTAGLAPALEDDVLADLKKKPYKLATRAHRLEDTEIKIGSVIVGTANPVMIAGPCSVESESQIMTCAALVKEAGGDMLRGGCFKPRTSPYSFQGLGHEGLDLLEEAGRRYELPTVTEVLEAVDVAAVAARTDCLQIGARNMQNFALLKEVGKVDRPVLLKRGMMATIDEWLAAAEYILAHGNRQVILCERGIRTFETSTRHTLDLGAIPVLRERTHLPVIVDPSHAAGTRRWVMPLARASLVAGAQGLMVEIHPEPEKALCDGPQALTPEMFAELMHDVKQKWPMTTGAV